jgi:quercetin dioxygenase-like cupin family protein
VGIVDQPRFEVMDSDPDDYRPGSSWALSVDPAREAPFGVIHERIGVGDRIPRHWHDVDEVVLYENGRARVHLDGLDREVTPGAIVFIPAGAVHGTQNIGQEPVEVRAVFPTTRVRIDAVERNPAPGTRDAVPQAVTYDFGAGTAIIHGPTGSPPIRPTNHQTGG